VGEILKKLLVLFFAFLFIGFAGTANAIDWTVANQATVAWDAVTQNVDGETFPADDVILYRLYIKKAGTAGDGTFAGETDALEFTLTFPTEGKWLAGVKTIRKPKDNPDDIIESEMLWSDSDDIVTVPIPFGIVFYKPPKSAGGFGKKNP